MRATARKVKATALLVALLRTRDAVERAAQRSTRGTGICHTDFVLLQDLQHFGPQRPGTIAVKLGLTSGSVTAALDRLESRGYIGRTSDPDDQRSRIVTLTEAGREFIVPAFREHERDLERLFGSAITDEERGELFDLLGRVRRSAREER